MTARRTNLNDIPARADLAYTPQFSAAILSKFRCQGDPLADKLAIEIENNHGGLTNIHDLLSTVRTLALESSQRGLTAQDCPLQGFLQGIRQVPSWVDLDRVAAGQRVHALHTPFIGLSLLAGSLVGGGQFITASVVTALAGNITHDPSRRVKQTGLLLAALAFPGALAVDGECHDAFTRIRLLHSALRAWLPTTGRLDKHKKMVPARVYVDGEVPINQHDLAITLGIFCYTNLRSLRRMSIRLSRQQIEDYVHMWRYAGYVLGIDEYLLPKSLEEQEAFMCASMLHQGAPEAMNEHNTKKFIDDFALTAHKNTGRWLPFSVASTYLRQIVRHLCGTEHTQGVNLYPGGDYHWAVLLTRLMGFCFGTVLPALPFAEKYLTNFHVKRIKRIIREQERLRGGPVVGDAPGSGNFTTADEADTNIEDPALPVCEVQLASRL